MKSHDQETKTLFAIVGIAIGVCVGYAFLSKLYYQLFEADPIGLLVIGFIALFWWVQVLSGRLSSYEKQIKGHVVERLADFSKRLDERERQISWLKHSESQAKEERTRLERWVEALSQDIRRLKANHKKLSGPQSAALEEAIREITTEVTE